MKILLLCVSAALISSTESADQPQLQTPTKTTPPNTSRPTTTSTPQPPPSSTPKPPPTNTPQPLTDTPRPPQVNLWDRKTPIKTDAKYTDLPDDLKSAVDIIMKERAEYSNTQELPVTRCKAMIEIQRHLVPLLVAYNMGKPFTILGPGGEKAEVKLQTGLFVTRIHSIWNQKIRCHWKAGSGLDPDTPRPLVPLFLEKS